VKNWASNFAFKFNALCRYSEVPGGVKAMAEEVSAWFKAKDFADIDAGNVHEAAK
jgi:hypothetical protein